jgi:hypothetical protein
LRVKNVMLCFRQHRRDLLNQKAALGFAPRDLLWGNGYAHLEINRKI